jgi:hypothetical protein
MKRVIRVTPLANHRLDLAFEDGVQGIADLSDLAGRGVFSSWLDPAAFERVAIGGAGDLVWPSGVDLCSDALYLRVTGQKPEDIFPSLKRDRVA